MAWTSVAAAAVILGSGILAATSTSHGDVLTAGDLLRADALSAFMVIVIGAVGLIATWSGVSSFDAATTERAAQRYGLLVPAFLATMVLAVLAANLGVMWAAVEGTTIVTAFLVGHRGGRASLEATWKYVTICSVGIALAYLGTVLVYFASQHAGPADHGSLQWDVLIDRSEQLDSGVMRVAFALLVLGFGAKAGLLPFHSWLPDAHSQAPAPVSALMSGVLLSVAAYALLRHQVVAAPALDPRFVRALLLTIGLASLAFAASMLLSQVDYKRMLAYSSIEHMGLVAIGVGIGTRAAIAAVLLHILGHGLAKAVLFCGAGQILRAEGSSRIADVGGLLVRRPALAGAFALGLVALLGLPPFSLFASEIALVRSGAEADLGAVVIAAVALVLVAFVAISVRGAGMLLGDPPTPVPSGGAPATAVPRAGAVTTVWPLAAGLVALAVIGVASAPLEDFLHTAATIGATR
jgi:hydrogenase-4 component F